MSGHSGDEFFYRPSSSPVPLILPGNGGWIWPSFDNSPTDRYSCPTLNASLRELPPEEVDIEDLLQESLNLSPIEEDLEGGDIFLRGEGLEEYREGPEGFFGDYPEEKDREDDFNCRSPEGSYVEDATNRFRNNYNHQPKTLNHLWKLSVSAENMNESASWLHTIQEKGEEVEFYAFDDYLGSTPLAKNTELKIYSNGECHTEEGSYNPLHKWNSIGSINGKEFVRSRTAPSFDIHRYLSPQELESAYYDDPEIPHHSGASSPLLGQRVTFYLEDDAILPGQVRDTSSRSSRDRTPRKRPPLERRGTAWTVDDEDDMLSIPIADLDGRSSPTPTTPQLYYTTPPHSQMASTSGSESRRSGSGKGGLSRLARRLSHKERRNNEERKKALRQRSVSLDCGDGRRSMMQATLEPPQQDGHSLSIPASPSLPTRLGNKSGLSSPNLAHRLSRRYSGARSKKGATSESGERKRRNVYDIQGLLDAVEHQNMDKVKEILDSNGLDVNSISEEELTPLDIAVLTNNLPMAKMLLSYGARENPKYQKTKESRSVQLVSLVNRAEKIVSELKSLVLDSSANSTNISSGQIKDCEKQLAHWEFRQKLFKRMKAGYDHARPPDIPTNVCLSVSSSNSLLVKFSEPEQPNGAAVTRYKVEWSSYEDFNPLVGKQTIDDPRFCFYEIPDLQQGNPYFVRVCAWNLKGFGECAVSNPPCAVPSNWRELDNVKNRADGKLQLLDELFVNMKNTRPAHASEIKDGHTPGSSPIHPRKSTMRKSIKNLFSSAPKFQKTLKRGTYIASLICNEDRILVTNEENLPILEVEETFSGTSIHTDLHWLMKIACTWEDVKSLRQDMDKSSSSGTMAFRSKLLQTISQLQSALGTQDLGQFYQQPIKDSQGAVVLVTVNYVNDQRAINSTHVKWMSLNKVERKLTGLEPTGAGEMLLDSAKEMITYQRRSCLPLSRGLYLGYLKLRSSVDLIRIMVPKDLPNIVPFAKIRDCPNVARDEWERLKNLSLNELRCPPTPTQSTFQQELTCACEKLLESLGISEDEAVSHRLYDQEVIELSEDVSMLLVLPPIENVCSIPGHHEEISQPDKFITLPVQVFEMIHMCTYRCDFISRYSRLSSILEMDTHLAQQGQREAFSSEEIAAAKLRLEQQVAFQQCLDEAWKGMRWTMEIITYARDKTIRGGLPLGVLYAPPSSPGDSPTQSRMVLAVEPGRDQASSGSGSDVASSGCSDCGYHSDIGSADVSNVLNMHNREGSEGCGVCAENNNQRESLEGDQVWTKVPAPPAGILRVYAAYETGLPKGASVKLHVTPRTTSREVINLIVQQLNKAVFSKGLDEPVYGDEDLEEFCLVAVIGARERVLRDDYQPLQLQNPWTKGRLYVRLKRNLLAAIEQGQVTTV